MLARYEQVHQQYLAQHVYGGGYLQKAGSLSQQFLTRTAALTDAHSKAMLSLYQSVQAQPSVLSYIDILQTLRILYTCMVPWSS
jgi:MFS transporter, DHA2 family, multidrug resistance protein